MFEFSILIGIYSYAIFLLGLIHFLNAFSLSIVSILFLFSCLYLSLRAVHRLPSFKSVQKLNIQEKLGALLIIVLSIVNFIGALGPETSFDALWYHLTIPKIFILYNKIFFIPGGLLYYSTMPKLVDILYIPALYFHVDFATRLLSFSFYILTLILIYITARLLLPKWFSILAVLIYASNLVVDWQATVSFIDSARTFFECLSVYYLIKFIVEKREQDLTKIGVSLGLAVATKILAIGSLFPVSVVLFVDGVNLKKIIKVIFISILIPFPWLVFSYIYTGYPFYPFFSSYFPSAPGIDLLAPIKLLRSPDPISPIYFICLPLIFFYYKKFNIKIKYLFVYSMLSFIIWWIFPQTGGGRFIMAYLPAYSVLVAALLYYVNKKLAVFLVFIIFIIGTISTVYRFGANAKYLPFLLGQESRSAFLVKNLNYKFGDFYDTDNYFANHIHSGDRVLT
ncbi:MAG TPA: glycosyltransferase family 39 protein, partial [Patescibacteria group bacterium]|nr:glycosyltransferase family 39 protein [Patescibacteria group bacterium]